MTRLLILLILVILLSHHTQSQTADQTARQPKFITKGKQEDYWAKQLFQNEYFKQRFNKFKGTIKVNGDSLSYPDETIFIAKTDKKWTNIFASGLFYPGVITAQQIKAIDTDGQGLNTAATFTVSNFEELPFLSNNDKQKRFRFWLFIKGFCNPVVCFIELTNEKANNKTGIKTFIKGATLTFFKNAWPVI